jgi:RimJ/RimL family protein N-acetyltransferase
MTQFWANQRERISHWGLARTASYYLLGVAPDKFGLRLLSAYEYIGQKAPVTPAADLCFSMLESMNDFTSHDLERLLTVQEESRLQLFSEYFARGGKCAVARSADSGLVCMTWMAFLNDYPISPGQPCVHFHNGLTWPDHRGKGLHPRLLSFACNFLRSGEASKVRIFIDCLLVNFASRKGIQRAGFTPIGIIVTAFRRNWHWTNHQFSQLVNTDAVVGG